MTPGYCVSLSVEGRRVVVVGGGKVAARRVRDLLAAGARVTVVAPLLSDALLSWATDGAIAAARRPFRPSDLDGAWLVLAATDDAAVNRAVVAAAEARHCFVSSADGAEASFRPMSVLRRGDLEVAVGTGGRSPALATWLRHRLEEELGPEYGTLLELVAEARAEATAPKPDADQDARRVGADPDWCAMFDSGILDAIRTGDLDSARRGLRTCPSSSSE